MSNHIKRLAQPRRWTTAKKVATWAPKPRPGPHAADDSLPLVMALRDVLGLAANTREAKNIIRGGSVTVDGRACRDHRRGLGFMDLVGLPEAEATFRVLYDTQGRIVLVNVPDAEAGWKLARIEDKTIIKKGRTQLNLHDGRNLVVKEDEYKTGDVLKLKLPEQEIAGHFPFTEGAPVYITGGSHIGEVARITEEQLVRSSAPNLMTLEGPERTFETIRPYVFVVGETDVEITLPEVSIGE